MFVGDTGTVSRMLNERELDIAIVSEPGVGSHVKQEPIGVNRLGWFAGADFEIARGVLTPQDLCRFHLIVSPPTARLHATVTQVVRRCRRRPVAGQHLQQPLGHDLDGPARQGDRPGADPRDAGRSRPRSGATRAGDTGTARAPRVDLLPGPRIRSGSERPGRSHAGIDRTPQSVSLSRTRTPYARRRTHCSMLNPGAASIDTKGSSKGIANLPQQTLFRRSQRLNAGRVVAGSQSVICGNSATTISPRTRKTL